ncbi:hypothetical protein AtNW77_Chr5g0112251 [Arabidopsis thaliana]|uniref:At5g27440 n=4 Tax=Arabidopsis TaxID=3701 RepID=Q6NQ21_ARATH|nr:uncharacterized protein AT5G27440 [Arabidopsis thaliana]KAG7603647.1 hypothetical protein ISN45_At05g025920 [Arabidopsis thaliana x Arabidopsis arenosa]KAG7610572.1 hypothetical protein ISN44_As05g025690 [Arabidopsis suecica]AAQ89665.1 At5g27440 [Arabidopsis thaliana]AED93687.1 transmembrane protein [Arabidopsis thaliana]CAD5332826.1 unnamed protein product [Arabidopsis thaliana]|eukprot:NP_198096.1 transmembrane protein [Arabidopsis thaliana]
MTLLHLTSHLSRFHFLNPQKSLRLSSISRVSSSISHRTQFQSLVLCAKKRKQRVGYRRITRFLFNSLSLLAPNLQILPQPLDLVIADLGGVDGGGGGRGGLGFWRGWGRFDGWRRKKNKVPILVFVCVILWIYGFCKISGIEIKSELVLKVLGLCLFGVTVVKELKREARFLVFGFLCVVASLVFGYKKENFVKLASRVRSCSSVLLGNKRSRRRV